MEQDLTDTINPNHNHDCDPVHKDTVHTKPKM